MPRLRRAKAPAKQPPPAPDHDQGTRIQLGTRSHWGVGDTLIYMPILVPEYVAYYAEGLEIVKLLYTPTGVTAQNGYREYALQGIDSR